MLWSFIIAQFVPENRVIEINPASCSSFPYVRFLKNFSTFHVMDTNMISDILFLLFLIHFYIPFHCSSDSFALAILNSLDSAGHQHFLYSGDFSQIVFFPRFRMTMSVTTKDNNGNSYDCEDVWYSHSMRGYTCSFDCFYSNKVKSIYIFTPFTLINDFIFINDLLLFATRFFFLLPLWFNFNIFFWINIRV